MPKLSIIILSYNTRDITKQCLQTLIKSLTSTKLFETEVIVADNASTDGTQAMLSEFKKTFSSQHISLVTIFNEKNEGFTRGNNQSARQAKGQHILFLNSDVIIDNVDWGILIKYFESDSNLAVLTVKVTLDNGLIDPASHRGFPTIFRSFCYYSKLETITKPVPYLNKVFGGYHLTDLDLSKSHEIDSPSGAFYLVKKDIFEKVHGFDEDFFMYGEDLDLSFRIKEMGYKIIYYPEFKVRHLKYQSGLGTADKAILIKTHRHFYDAMHIFYKKHYAPKYPKAINQLIYFLIKLKSQL